MFQNKITNDLKLIFHDFEVSILPKNTRGFNSKNNSFSEISFSIYQPKLIKSMFTIFSDDHDKEQLNSKDRLQIIVESMINASRLSDSEESYFFNSDEIELLTYLPQIFSSEFKDSSPLSYPSSHSIPNSVLSGNLFTTSLPPLDSTKSKQFPNQTNNSKPLSKNIQESKKIQSRAKKYDSDGDNNNNIREDYNNTSNLSNTSSLGNNSQFFNFVLFGESFDKTHLDTTIFDKDLYDSSIRQSENQINIHTGSLAEQITDQYNADAVTFSGNIFFSKGKFNLSTPPGISLFVHELTHAKQIGEKADRNILQYKHNDLEQEALQNERETLQYTNFMFNNKLPYIHTTVYDDINFLNSLKKDFNFVLDNKNSYKSNNNNIYLLPSKNKFSNHKYPKNSLNIRTFLTTNYNNDQFEEEHKDNKFYNNNIDKNKNSIYSESIINTDNLRNKSLFNINFPNSRLSTINNEPSKTSLIPKQESLPEKISQSALPIPLFAKKDRSIESASSFTNFPNMKSSPTTDIDSSSNNLFLETKIDIDSIAKKVFEILERKIKIERTRRGIW